MPAQPRSPFARRLFARRLLALRAAADLDRREAARRIGVAPSTLYRWEEGLLVPRFAQYPAIVEAYGVPFAALFAGFAAEDVRRSVPKTP